MDDMMPQEEEKPSSPRARAIEELIRYLMQSEAQAAMPQEEEGPMHESQEAEGLSPEEQAALEKME